MSKKKTGRSTSSATRKTAESYAKEVFQNRVSQFQKKHPELQEYLIGLDFDYHRCNRRISAAVATAEEITGRFEAICGNIPGIFSLEEDWISANAYPVSAYDYIEKYTCSALAAAIWILDHVRDRVNIASFTEFLSSVPLQSIQDLPAVWDPCHSMPLLEKLAALLYSHFGNNGSTDKNNDITRYYIGTATVNRSAKQTGCQSIFDKLLSFLDPDDLNQASAYYQEKYWDWVERYYLSRKCLLDEEMLLRAELELYQKEFAAASSRENPPPVNALQKPQPAIMQANPLFIPQLDQQQQTHAFRMRGLEHRGNLLRKKQEDFNAKFESFMFYVGEFPVQHSALIAQKFGQQIANIWRDFTIGDPYALTMGFLMHLDRGSHLPWCYFGGIHLYCACVASLPWTRTRHSQSCDNVWNHYDHATQSIVSGPSEDPLPGRIRVAELEDWYKLSFYDSQEDASHQERYNMAQILYETTGCLMPRNLNRYQPALKTWARYGINGKKNSHYLQYCMSILGEASHQTKSAASNEIQQSEAYLALKKQLELEKAKNAAYQSELQDLSSVVFHTQRKPTWDKVRFPHNLVHKMVIYGGDALWVTEMQAKFPELQFMPENKSIPADAYRTLDAIWIMPQNLSHPRYCRITEEAHSFKVPVRYFTCSSATDCALELATADLAQK